jgi:hypothetical protein
LLMTVVIEPARVAALVARISCTQLLLPRVAAALRSAVTMAAIAARTDIEDAQAIGAL